MSEREGFLNLNLQNAAAIRCNTLDKVEQAARLCPQILARRQLADISNLPQKGRVLIQDQKLQLIPTTTKEYIEQLQKENLALAKMLAQKNKVIEQSGIELERLRSNYIKMREQNQQLALSHSLMLAEVNSGKDRLKALQHELGCKNGLLHAKNSKQEVCVTEPAVNLIKEDEPSKEGEDHKKPRNVKKRLRSRSLGSSEQSQSEDNAGNRQSSRFKAVKPDGNSLSETHDPEIPKCALPDGTAPSTSVDASANNEDHVANRPSVRRQSARFKAVTPCLIPDETVQENGSTSVEIPSVRRQSTRFKAKRPKQADDTSEMDNTISTNCSSLDEPVPPVPENGSTSVEMLVINDGHAAQRPSVRRPSTRFKAKIPKQEDDPSEMDNTISTYCSSLDEPVPPVPENGSASVETSVINEGHAAQRPSVRRPSTRFKAKVPKQADDQSEVDNTISTNCSSLDEPVPPVPENGSASVETSVINEGHAAQRPSVRRPSTRFKAKIPKQEDDPSEMDNTISTNCSFLDEPVPPVPEKGSTSVETPLINEGHAAQRPSVSRQSTRFKTKIPKQADDPSEMDTTISTNCSSLDEPVPPIPENGSTSGETLVENEDLRSGSGWGSESQGSEKPSLGRPSRVAARKVQTYREIPLNVKMRRAA